MVEAGGEGEDALVDCGEDVGVAGHVVVAFLDLGRCEVGESELWIGGQPCGSNFDCSIESLLVQNGLLGIMPGFLPWSRRSKLFRLGHEGGSI